MSVSTEPIDAATVVVARDTEEGIEVLMLRRNSKIYFGGMWVFPGGRVDEGDRADEMLVSVCDDGDGRGFHAAAIREAQEEAGIDLSNADLHHFAHWLPPAVRPKRFSTQFFLAIAPQDHHVAIDHGEITEHHWMTPANALRRRSDGEIEIVTPTFCTLNWLKQFRTVPDACAAIKGPECFHTHIKQVAGSDPGMVAFYSGDVSYDSLDLEASGPRRRCYMLQSAWWWEEHEGEEPNLSD
ncbi:MAG TPA: NUDIX hydrolase [Acidimicrobiales bacterium]|nr:NUDIX hydrolase [Acidimicrobiales bacterium]